MPVTELGEPAPTPWVWPGYVARGYITLFTGLWKAGKTTLIGSLLHDLYAGGGLVSAPIGGKTLVITEEHEGHWRRRAQEFNLAAQVRLCWQPFMGKPTYDQWNALIEWIVAEAHKHGIWLVIIDTLASVWPVKDENNASEVYEALLPFRALTNAGLAVVLVHHPRKGGGEEGQAARGSGALPGFVDAIVEMRRFAESDLTDTRRVLTTLSRLSDIQPEAVLNFADGKYSVVGDRAKASQEDRLEVIKSLLPSVEPGLTIEEVHEAWKKEPKPGRTKLSDDLDVGSKRQMWVRTGAGVKKSAFRFHRATGFHSPATTLLSGGNESNQQHGGEGTQ